MAALTSLSYVLTKSLTSDSWTRRSRGDAGLPSAEELAEDDGRYCAVVHVALATIVGDLPPSRG